MSRTTLLLTCTLTVLACDVDDGTLPLESELDALAAMDDDDDDDAPVFPTIDGLAAEAPDPSAGYYDCPGAANFCFWYNYAYGGSPYWLSGGDFAIPNFGSPIYSMKKRHDTRRVKVFSGANYTGACKVINPEGGAKDEPYLPFPVMSAKRIETSAPGTC